MRGRARPPAPRRRRPLTSLELRVEDFGEVAARGEDGLRLGLRLRLAARVAVRVVHAHQARFITDDEVQKLVTAHNPDGAGTDPAWLSGPGPINFWRTHFARTIADSKHHGVVHMMVVNTEEQYALHNAASGEHWILLAWFIEPAA